MKPNTVILLVVATAMLVAILFFASRKEDEHVPAVSSASNASSAGANREGREANVSVAASHSGMHRDPVKSEAIRRAILRALQSDAQSSAPVEPPVMPGRPQRFENGGKDVPDDGGMSAYAKSIQDRMREDLIPMAEGCYKNLLAKHPDAGGKVVMEFEILHDEKLGGVVNEPELGDGGTLNDREFSTCVRESLSAVYFDAPPGKGKITVKYPITLSPDEPDAG
jgi:hypothetical protein